jgi:hypothetical protein
MRADQKQEIYGFCYDTYILCLDSTTEKSAMIIPIVALVAQPRWHRAQMLTDIQKFVAIEIEYGGPRSQMVLALRNSHFLVNSKRTDRI